MPRFKKWESFIHESLIKWFALRGCVSVIFFDSNDCSEKFITGTRIQAIQGFNIIFLANLLTVSFKFTGFRTPAARGRCEWRPGNDPRGEDQVDRWWRHGKTPGPVQHVRDHGEGRGTHAIRRRCFPGNWFSFKVNLLPKLGNWVGEWSF